MGGLGLGPGGGCVGPGCVGLAGGIAAGGTGCP